MKNWFVEFENKFSVIVTTPESNRDKIMGIARKMLSDDNRYNFEKRRASGGRITKFYEVRK